MTTVIAPAISGFADDEIRVDGRDKVSGRLRYTADIKRPNMLWAAFTTSPYAHAKIVRIDTTAAKAVPGVRAVLTAAIANAVCNAAGVRPIEFPITAERVYALLQA